MPVLFLGHGNPMHALDDNPLTRAWREAGARIPRPRAILAISAHWLTRGIAITASPRPETVHDFEGFPRALSEFQYPAPGDPALAVRVAGLLGEGRVALDLDWGLDHGAWSVLTHLYPEATIPVAQLSLDIGLDAPAHYALGQKLRPLRDEGVLILGSGNVVHNLRAMTWRQPHFAHDWAERFNQRTRAALASGRYDALLDLADADARLAVPTPDHYWPLLYIAALAREDESPRFFNDVIEYGAIGMLACQFGE
jgi:4,5-DOPA dioxygenase extradiol